MGRAGARVSRRRREWCAPETHKNGREKRQWCGLRVNGGMVCEKNGARSLDASVSLAVWCVNWPDKMAASLSKSGGQQNPRH